jgi:putative endonuclease
VEQHRRGSYSGFAAKHDCHKLLWFETHLSRHEAFKRERQIKEWRRAWKIELIEALNPNWDDLTVNLTLDEVESERRMFRIPFSVN